MSVILVNGRGQLGTALKNALPSFQNEIEEKVYVYHTWNIEEKSEEKQKIEYEKFLNFISTVDKKSKIIFISTTKSETQSWYVFYKQLAEAFLLVTHPNCVILKFPTLIGKGILQKLKYNLVDPFGVMELLTIEDASNHVIEKIRYDGVVKQFFFEGEKIKAFTVQRILQIK